MTACEVWPGVFIGDLTAAHFWPGPKLAVRDQDADYIFRCLGDKRIKFVYGRAPVALYQEAAAWLDSLTAERNHPPVLIHCSGGLHRSAAVVVYWLVARKNIESVDRAYQILRIARRRLSHVLNGCRRLGFHE